MADEADRASDAGFGRGICARGGHRTRISPAPRVKPNAVDRQTLDVMLSSAPTGRWLLARGVSPWSLGTIRAPQPRRGDGVDCRPYGARCGSWRSSLARGLRPWLTTVAPAGHPGNPRFPFRFPAELHRSRTSVVSNAVSFRTAGAMPSRPAGRGKLTVSGESVGCRALVRVGTSWSWQGDADDAMAPNEWPLLASGWESGGVDRT